MRGTDAARPRRRQPVTSRMSAALLIAALTLTGCSPEDSLSEQAQAGDNKNYIAGDGSVAEYGPENRGDRVQLTGTLFDGTTLDQEDWTGDVVVLNFWYAACAPCRTEAPTLNDLSKEFADQGVRFYGINVRDEQPTAEAFERNFGVTYPSFKDKDGKILLSLTQYVPPQAVPTTLILDRQGRISARILGVAEKTTLKTLIEDVLP
ncbi:TlpA disulfide reductase family protein [Arthrobacter koreensis]|uniref:TlpA family protein disulfide reductase n=2 Tax=Arthrobacter koreensis TaxID=199136 RepID=UPI00126513C1|nr:TlpA disulfide reductase family protein [Arthrobacter koreensis]